MGGGHLIGQDFQAQRKSQLANASRRVQRLQPRELQQSRSKHRFSRLWQDYERAERELAYRPDRGEADVLMCGGMRRSMTAGTRAKARDYEVSKHLWGLLPNGRKCSDCRGGL